ncbi:NUDIX hydrolase [Patescibacteria group bacterium AH-259-L05]|nr:NUDIX hydrolase [Patescibacteria group bacterium AH-259-L05]
MGKTKKTKLIPEKPHVAVDIVIFTIIKDRLSILLIRRGVAPFKGQWALPGGRVNKNEPLEKAAARELGEETGVKDIYLEQLYTFGAPFRDPRGRTISVAYFALISKLPKLKATTDAEDAQWFPVRKIPQRLGFDHNEIISYALKRLRWKLEYTNIASNLLPKYFTLSELQRVYEIILGKKLDKRNFRKRILSLGLIKPTRKKRKNVAYRPPQLWKFITHKHIVLDKRELVF